MVELLAAGHTESDAFPVRAVELVGSLVRVEVGRDVRLLRSPPLCVFL